MSNQCDHCQNLQYDEEMQEYYCDISLDEDEMERYMKDSEYNCAYFKYYDEYKMVQKQN